jgi:FkbM family methyltransferase
MLTYDVDPSCQVPGAKLIEIYDRYFSDKIDGTYVEVGAFDGVTHGHTSPLAQLGWRGLCIEAHPEFAERCRKNHAGRDVTVEVCAIGATEGEATLYVAHHEGGAVSSTQWTNATRIYGLDKSRAIQTPMHRLDGILEKHGIAPGFEVLTIDVEEAELEVLAGFSVNKWLPRVVFIETHEKDPDGIRNWKAAPIGKFFGEAGYEKLYADHINTIFARSGQ